MNAPKQKSSTLGYVSFDAQYTTHDKLSIFAKKVNFIASINQWFYVGGKPLNPHRPK